jgi:hypothetical protein
VSAHTLCPTGSVLGLISSYHFSMLLSLVGPYLPLPAQQVLQAFQPLINLLSNPASLAYTAYNNPTQIPGILVHTLSNVFGLLRMIDIGSLTDGVTDLFTDPSSKSLSDWWPLLVSGLAIWLSMRTVMSTLRVATGLFSTVFRYGSLFTLAISLFGWVTGGRNAGGNAPANGGGIGDIFSTLNNAVGGGQQAGFANMARGFAGEMADAWQKGQQESAGKAKRSSSSRSRKSKTPKAQPATDATGAGGDLADMAQKWVKEALWKATMGGGEGDKKTGKTKNR